MSAGWPAAWGHLKPSWYGNQELAASRNVTAPVTKRHAPRAPPQAALALDAPPRRIQLVTPLPPSKNRLTRRKRMGAGWVDYPSDEKKRFAKTVAALGMGSRPIQGPVRVQLLVYQGLTPKGRPQHCDLPNYEELLFDVLQGVAYLNDSQLVDVHTRLLRDNANPRIEVTVEEAR